MELAIEILRKRVKDDRIGESGHRNPADIHPLSVRNK
jgi:hypothetical protein